MTVVTDIWRPPVFQGHRGFFADTAFVGPTFSIQSVGPFGLQKRGFMSAKDDIRNYAKRHRDEMMKDAGAAEAAASVFRDALALDAGMCVSVYFPIGSEFDPTHIVEELWSRQIKVALPSIQGAAQPLRFLEWRKDSLLQKAGFGTYEPVDADECIPDIVIVPLLAFDQQGNRIGYGQGHYDATLKDLRSRKNILAVGLAYSGQAVLLALPTETHDEKLDLVVTEQRVFDFRR